MTGNKQFFVRPNKTVIAYNFIILFYVFYDIIFYYNSYVIICCGQIICIKTNFDIEIVTYLTVLSVQTSGTVIEIFLFIF